MSDSERYERPELPSGFDSSRARARRDDPAGWRFSATEQAALRRAIDERRDIRRFRPDPLPADLLRRLLSAAHAAPSVGLSQPWHFIVVESEQTKAAMHAHASQERLVQARHFDERARQFLDLKIEGIREAPVSIVVCCDRGDGSTEILGRHTIPDTDLYSTSCAIQNLWLTGRAEGVGVGWVSFYRTEFVRRLLGLPERVVPVAWLCLGYPDERPQRPGLEAAGWSQRTPLEQVIHREHWGDQPAPDMPAATSGPLPRSTCAAPHWWQTLAAGIVPGNTAAVVRVRDASDELVKPAGSLGLLETLVERWALATGSPPPLDPRPAIAVFAADHGVAAHGVSLYPRQVSAQVAAAAARGETAIGVLARAIGAELVVVDVGLTGPAPAGVSPRRVANGTADITCGPALTEDQLRQAVQAGHDLVTELAHRCDVLLLGEIGIGNTTVASALLAALTGLPAEAVCGRGTGLDAQGLDRKRQAVTAALSVNRPALDDPLGCLRTVGGLELAALTGALLAAAAARKPVILDGFTVGVAALTATRATPLLLDYLIAGHLSAEPAHRIVLEQLGLEPLLDLRLRLGEASGAASAYPLIRIASHLHHELRTFDEAAVERQRNPERQPDERQTRAK